MRRLTLCALFALVPLTLMAQEEPLTPEVQQFLQDVLKNQSGGGIDDGLNDPEIQLITKPNTPRKVVPVPPAPPIAVTAASGAIVRGLDKAANQTTDLTLTNGQSGDVGPLKVTVSDCRYPTDNPSSDAFAHLTITDQKGAPLFDGWMVASSPALSALDNPRYDVWVLNCIIPAG